MKKILLILAIVCAFSSTHAQFVHKIKADSVLITNDSCTAELNLENSTKHIKGFLYNKGNGRTEFRKVTVLNDSTMVFGDDTLVIKGSGGKLTNGNGTTVSGTWPNRQIDLGGNLNNTVNWTGTSAAHVFNYTNNSIPGFTPAFNINVGSSGGNSWGLQVTNSGSASYAIRGMSSNSSGFNTGVLGSAVNGIGVQGNTNSITGGIFSAGVVGFSGKAASIALRAYSAPNETGSGTISVPVLDIYRTSTIAIGNGIGAIMMFSFPSYDNQGLGNINPDHPVQLEAKMLNLFGDERTAELNFTVMGDSTMKNVLKLHGDGNVILPQYNNTNWDIGDPTGYKTLVVDNNGNLRKYNGSIGGGTAIGNSITGGTSGSILFISSTGNLAQDHANLNFTANTLSATNISGRIIPRVGSAASLATITPDALTQDVFKVTALAENATIAAPNGAFTDGQIIILRVKDNGTARTLTWNAIYRAGNQLSLPANTEAGKTKYLTFIWNNEDTKLDFVGLSTGF